jgi:hypothetical protein
LVAEAMVLAASCGVIGIVLANALLAGLLALYPQRLPVWQTIAIDYIAVLYTGALVVVAGFLVAQGELLRDQALHQSFRIRDVLLAAPGPAIRLRLGEMQRTREVRRSVVRPAARSPVLFQGLLHWSPVLRGRLHDDFLDLVLDQPVG